MAINQAMRLALKALSYPDIKDGYKLKRAVQEITTPKIKKALYSRWDEIVVCDGREIPVRIYPCKEDTKENLIIFIHGGGWTTESVDTYNRVCRTMTRKLKCRVVSIEYRLAPENPFPAGLQDCYSVTRKIFTNPKLLGVPADRITLIGDSAGGNLAAAISLLARDRGDFKVERQVLIYPAVYNDYTERSPFSSVMENGFDYLLTAKKVEEYMALYKSSDKDLANPYFAPYLAKSLKNQPKTLIVTAEYDPLRDEGEAYAKRLLEEGNEVICHRVKDGLHGFFLLDAHFVHVKKTYEWIQEFLLEEYEACEENES